jgi:hypothetical protein
MGLFWSLRKNKDDLLQMAGEFEMDEAVHTLTNDASEEARRNPGGWVYKIEGNYGPDDAVPPEAIVGAWKVDEDGNITGDFIPNPNYRPSKAGDNRG